MSHNGSTTTSNVSHYIYQGIFPITYLMHTKSAPIDISIFDNKNLLYRECPNLSSFD